MDLLLIVGVIVLWYVLNKWILPKFGIQTWIADSCKLPRDGSNQSKADPGGTDGQGH